MAVRPDQDARRRAEKKSAPVVETALPYSAQEIIEERWAGDLDPIRWEFRQDAVDLFGRRVGVLKAEARELALWDAAVESLGRTAGVLEKLAESPGDVIAHIAARGDRIDRIQNDTRALLKALVASEADA